MDVRANASGSVPATRSGFTMVELMTVSAIVPIVTIAFVSLIVTAKRSADRLDARANARQAATSAIRSWRVDVSLADRVEIGEHGASLTTYRLAKRGGSLTARYAMDGEGRLVRETRGGEDPRTRTLVSGVTDLRFTGTGRGYGVEWTVRHGSGGERLEWTFEGFATPLARP